MPLNNLGNYPPTLGNTQDQVFENEMFRQNQALFQKYTAVDGGLKRKCVSTGGRSHKIQTSARPNDATAFILEIRDNRPNLPREKFCQDDGALRPHRTHVATDKTIEEGDIVFASRREDDF